MRRVFSLEEAQTRLPEILRLTGPAIELCTSLAEDLEQAEQQQDEEAVEAVRQRIQTVVESWAGAMEDMDAEVKGLWLVDFDSGDGYWCWAWPERSLDHWHSYTGGFSSRMKASERPGNVLR